MQPTARPTAADQAADAHRVRSVQLYRTHGNPRRRAPASDKPWHWALGLVLAVLLVIAIGAWIDEIGAEHAATPAPSTPAHGCAAQPVHPTTGAT
jgi:hypothetical protein